MGNNSGRVSSATFISGGRNVWTIEVGRELARVGGFWLVDVGDDAVSTRRSDECESVGDFCSVMTGSGGGVLGSVIELMSPGCLLSEEVRE